MPDVYVFSSQSVTNIWAGIGARAWAVSRSQADNVGGAVKKSRDLPVGAFGIFYCSEIESLTTPFIIYSKPIEGIPIRGIWEGEWTLLFRIHPMGTPGRRLPKQKITESLPTLRETRTPWHHVFRYQPTTLFVPTQLADTDWSALLAILVGDVVADWQPRES
ncbi:MAG: hypothetical protein ACRENK_07835 [Gemmatimonadaceae bacterium]